MGDQALAAKAESLCNISQQHIEQCYNNDRGVYTQAIGVDYLDASTLHLITMRYLDPAFERARNHLTAIEKDLLSPQGLVYRYTHKDDFGQPESAFTVCSFWYIEALACVDRIEDACRVLNTVIKGNNHLGLLSEDSGFSYGQWGDFPQTYSHVGLVNAVYRIANKRGLPIFY